MADDTGASTEEERKQEYVTALKEELAGYQAKNDERGIKDVTAELKKQGASVKETATSKAPETA